MAKESDYRIAEIQDDLLANADFEETDSVAKAKAFITHANRWLILRPQSSSHQGNSINLDLNQVKEMKQRAQEFVKANDTASAANSSVRFFSAENYR